MEEILASIKRIIAEDGEGAPAPARRNGRRSGSAAGAESGDTTGASSEDEVLELTERVEAPVEPDLSVQQQSAEEPVSLPNEDAPVDAPPPLVSQPAERASRDAIAALSALVVKPEAPGTDSLEGMVREMLRPMLKEWLDARLPDVVEQIVQREIARIVGNR